jgi:alkanesulfonate monooxygenase SsuD/methylene tetrahydromethanopterin reductase-like flavin-dependent oxidoreductase (luciferase family)
MHLSAHIPSEGPSEKVLSLARLADSLGFRSVNCGHIASRDSFTTLGAIAVQTRNVALGTSVVPIYTRTPASMAQSAATVDDLSGGRFRLGLGVGHRVTMGDWHGQRIGRPTAEMREYVSIVRAILTGQQAPAGERWSSTFALMGFRPRADLPIHLAGLSPAMLRLAGEIADGVVLWSTPPQYIRDVVLPEVAAGRARVGRSMDGFAVQAVVASACGGERAAVLDGARTALHRYLGLPFYRAMFAAAGFSAQIEAYDTASNREAQKAAIGEDFVETLCLLGDEDDLLDGIRRYEQAGATELLLASVPGTDLEPVLSAAGRAITNDRAAGSVAESV